MSSSEATDGPAEREREPAGAEGEKRFRQDIQGIRGVALVIVLLTHARINWAQGGFVGLDVFFVLSGFLITGLLLAQLRRKGEISLREFYGRRAKRLLPAAATVLVFVAVTSAVLYGIVMRMETGGDVIAASLYFVNWHFIHQGIDYFAFQDAIVSPVQHYWSLSVEEQFYVFWPLVLVGLAWLAAKIRRRRAGVVLTATILITIASLAYSIVYSPANPDAAYFSTLTRIWQILSGAILAMILPRSIAMPRILSEILVIGGIATVLVTWLVFNETDPYPGWRALLPVGGTVALIIGGTAVYRGIGVRFLAWRPFQYLGKISYSWYLWHWPFVVFAMVIWGNEIGTGGMLLIIAASWVPAQLAHVLIEEPFRRSRDLNRRPVAALAVGLICSVVAVGAGLTIGINTIDIEEAPERAIAAEVSPADGTAQQKVKRIRPLPEKARKDRGAAFKDCLVMGPVTESPACRFGKTRDPAKKIVLFGDSHSLQYSPPLIDLARKYGWQLTVLSRAGCLVADVTFRPNCDAWRQNAFRRIERERPDLVVVSTGTLDRYRLGRDDRKLSRDESQPALVEAMARTLRKLKATSGRVAVIRDQARAPFLPYECVAENSDNVKKCIFDSGRRPSWAFDLDASRQTGVPVLDPEKKLCYRGKCPSVIGDVLVYRDTYHLSATFSRSLAPWLYRNLPGVK